MVSRISISDTHHAMLPYIPYSDFRRCICLESPHARCTLPDRAKLEPVWNEIVQLAIAQMDEIQFMQFTIAQIR